MNDKELELIRRLKKKDQEALEEIIRLFHQYAAAIISRILYGQADRIDMQGVINDVFFRLWEHADSIDPEKGGSLKSYIGALARNTAIAEKKKLRNTVSLEEDIFGNLPDQFHQAELRSVILSALKELTLQQIADEWRLPLPTVKSRLQRSRKKFKTILEERGFSYEDHLL